MQRSWCAALGACLLLGALEAKADVFTFAAILTGGQEVPPNASTATGSGTFVLDDQGTVATVDDTLAVSLTFSGLTAPAAAAHIHAPAPPGTNAPVRLDFGPFGFPFGVTAGSFDHVFLLSADLSPLITVDAFEAALFAGNTYVNIHNSVFSGGEIRGQIVPEPGTLGLLGAVLAALSLRSRRRRLGRGGVTSC
jgi:hypothetical protein